MTGAHYVHGYSGREAERLRDQADALSGLLHEGIAYANGRLVLEAGCGTGAQTVYLAKSSPGAEIVSIDFSEESIRQARRRLDAAGCGNVRFHVADLYALPLEEASFDDAFLHVLPGARAQEREVGERSVLRPLDCYGWSNPPRNHIKPTSVLAS